MRNQKGQFMPIQTNPEIEKVQEEIISLKKRLTEMKQALEPKIVENYTFNNWDGGETKLSEMFGSHDLLVVIHNMGQKCKYCTMWANGFEGLYKHFNDKAGFVLINPDSVDKQKEFNKTTGWTFPIYSSEQNSFNKDTGFADGENNPWPGVSTFRKLSDGTIELIGQASFGPGDDFCPTWPIYDLLPGTFEY